jgi:hypothetical protein
MQQEKHRAMKNATHVIIVALSLGATAILLPDIAGAVRTLATNNFVPPSTCRMNDTEVPAFSPPHATLPLFL